MSSDHGNRDDGHGTVMEKFEHSKEAGTRLLSEYIEYTGASGGLKTIEQQFHATCSQLRSLMRMMEMAVDEADSEQEAEEYSRMLSKQRYEYEEILKGFKAAALGRKEKERQQRTHARQELLGSTQASVVRKQWKNESDLVSASQKITESMKRTKNILAQELEQSGAQLAALGMSQETLAKSHKEYNSQHTKLKRAKRLISTVDWQNKSERYLLWAGLSLFCAVAFYIIQKRALYFVPPSLRPMAFVRYAMRILFGNKKDPSSSSLLHEQPDSVEDPLLHEEL